MEYQEEAFVFLNLTENYHDMFQDAQKDLEKKNFPSYLLFSHLAICSSALEYSLNHALIYHAISTIGPLAYRKFSESLIGMRFKNKLHSAPIIITNGKYRFNPEHKSIKSIEEMISVRNALLHRKEFLRKSPVIQEENGHYVTAHVPLEKTLFGLTKERCLRFGHALINLKAEFFVPIEKNEELLETDLIIAGKVSQ